MRKLAQKREIEKQNETLYLDEYVGRGAKDRSGVFYIQETEEDLITPTGMLYVCDPHRKPGTHDLVYCKTPQGFALNRYCEIRKWLKPLRLATSDGKRVNVKIGFNSVEVFGVITHVVKTLVGGKQ
jgi:hypothetical protein